MRGMCEGPSSRSQPPRPHPLAAVFQIGNPESPTKPNKKYYDPRMPMRSGEEAMAKRLGEAMEDLRRWRKEKPQAASEIARQRAAEAALSMEGGGGGGSAAASSQRGFGGLLEGGSEWE